MVVLICIFLFPIVAITFVNDINIDTVHPWAFIFLFENNFEVFSLFILLEYCLIHFWKLQEDPLHVDSSLN